MLLSFLWAENLHGTDFTSSLIRQSQNDFTSKSPDFLRMLETLVNKVFSFPFTSPQTRLQRQTMHNCKLQVSRNLNWVLGMQNWIFAGQATTLVHIQTQCAQMMIINAWKTSRNEICDLYSLIIDCSVFID